MPRKSSPRQKKKKDASALSLQDNLSHPVQAVYHLLIMMGVVKNKNDIALRYEGVDYSVSIALPMIKYAIAFDGDKTSGLENDGWMIQNVAYRDVEPFSRVFFAVDNSRVAQMYSRADPNVKTTSIPEEKLMVEFTRRKLPLPHRNYKFNRDDGSELTTPDFTWEEWRIVFFMDGAYWHSVKDDKEIIKEIKSSRKMQNAIIDKRKDKVRKDGAIRSELSSRGWTVLTCTDDDISDAQGVKDVVDMVERAMRTIEETRRSISGKQSMSQEDADFMLQLLDEDAHADTTVEDAKDESEDGISGGIKVPSMKGIDDSTGESQGESGESIIDIINSSISVDDEDCEDTDDSGEDTELLQYDEM